MSNLSGFFNPSDGFLNCGICNKPLSLPPILHSATLGNICGRCEDRGIEYEGGEEIKFSRQKIYEKLAKRFTFPCAYKVFGCDSELNWDSVPDHETSCEFKNMHCPLSNERFQENCEWTGVFEKLEAHIKKDHKALFVNPLQITLTREYQSKMLFSEIMGRLVIIIMDYRRDLSKYYCSVLANLSRSDCLLHEYRIEISTIAINKPQLEPIYGNLDLKPEGTIGINISALAPLFEASEEILVKFSIFKKGAQDIQSASNEVLNVLTQNVEGNGELNENLLPDLECPICVEFMAPPIFICEAGHNVCNNCNNQIDACPLCRGRMCGGRNFILEKLTATINYPCMNRPHCGFVGLLTDVKKHEKNCLLAERRCIKNDCAWKGINVDLVEHVEQTHTILELRRLHKYKSEMGHQQYIISFDDRIFIFNMKFNINQPLVYDVRCLGENEVRYKHELEIIGSSVIDIKVTLGHLCQPVPFTQKNGDEAKKISIPFDFLNQFLTHFNELDFKISIKKI